MNMSTAASGTYLHLGITLNLMPDGEYLAMIKDYFSNCCGAPIRKQDKVMKRRQMQSEMEEY